MKKKVAVYPYNSETKLILQDRHVFDDIEVMAVIVSQDAEIMEDLQIEYPDIYFTTDAKKCANMVDALVICDNVKKFSLRGFCDVIDCWNEKEIILGIPMYSQLKDKLKENKVNILNDNWNDTDDSEFTYDVSIPIITIVGMGENCNKFNTQLLLKKGLNNTNYRVLYISSNPLGKFWNMITLPQFMYSTSVSLSQKIIRFNHFLNEKVRQLRPDLVVLGCPSGIMPLNEYENNYFAELTNVMTATVISDIGFFNTYYLKQTNNDFYEGLQEICLHRYNVPIEYFLMSNQQYHVLREEKKIEYRFFSDVFTEKDRSILNELEYNIYSVDEEKKLEQNLKEILKQLESNIDII